MPVSPDLRLKAGGAPAEAQRVTAPVLPAIGPELRGINRLPFRLLGLGLAFLLLPNLAIIGIHLLAQRSQPASSVSLPIKNFAEVDSRLWRGAAPDARGYGALAAHGVVTVIDLRAEDDIRVDDARLAELGITRIHLPLRDGQAPSQALVNRFLQAVEDSPGLAYVHCGAGVGRTGTMSAAYLVNTGQATPKEALQRNLRVGPPSLEQIAFSASLSVGSDVRRPRPLLVAVSRALDAPRRIWTNLRG
ncbi:MAG TPA: dual specificity protein phosphatase family protein [Acidimicrobiales bacterium]|nr:dual specificity protein phosphatase family protein [Acidimicrobiales bacterium]